MLQMSQSGQHFTVCNYVLLNFAPPAHSLGAGCSCTIFVAAYRSTRLGLSFDTGTIPLRLEAAVSVYMVEWS